MVICGFCNTEDPVGGVKSYPGARGLVNLCMLCRVCPDATLVTDPGRYGREAIILSAVNASLNVARKELQKLASKE